MKKSLALLVLLMTVGHAQKIDDWNFVGCFDVKNPTKGVDTLGPWYDPYIIAGVVSSCDINIELSNIPKGVQTIETRYELDYLDFIGEKATKTTLYLPEREYWNKLARDNDFIFTAVDLATDGSGTGGYFLSYPVKVNLRSGRTYVNIRIISKFIFPNNKTKTILVNIPVKYK